METPSVLATAVDRLLLDCAAEPGQRQVLDLGGGTGGQAVRLATLGHHVTVVDPSLDALAALARRVSDAGLGETLRGVQGDAEDLAAVVENASIDLVLCHGVLEVVDDPSVALASIRRVLRPTGRLSLLVTQREAGVLSRVAAGQIRAAAAMLADPAGRWGPEDPLQRRFTRAGVTDLLRTNGFEPVSSEGIRVLTDLVPVSATVNDPHTQALLDQMEHQAGTIPALRDIAAHLHVNARLL